MWVTETPIVYEQDVLNMDRRGSGWFGIGFLALTFGNAIGAVHMFRGDLIAVMTGVALMFGGFQVMHYGAHGEGMVSQLSYDSSEMTIESSVRTWILTPLLLLVAVYCIAQGFVIGAQAAVQSFTLVEMGSSAAFIVGGYMVGHVSIHGVLL